MKQITTFAQLLHSFLVRKARIYNSYLVYYIVRYDDGESLIELIYMKICASVAWMEPTILVDYSVKK